MKVIITGFAGTLGSAFTEYCLNRGDMVTGIDNNEWAVASFFYSPNLTKVLGDFSDYEGECDLLIHCAAYKHVELLEDNPISAIENNIENTKWLYLNVKAKQTLFISTDKAVEPISIYGKSKARGEQLTWTRGGVVARLGNIKGSSGSVIPKWEAAVESGIPLPITDLSMTRWMIGADSAVRSVMSMLDSGCPLIIPEMGKPISLQDIVDEFLESHMLPMDYPTNIIGIRRGEKIHEKLFDETKEDFSVQYPLGTAYTLIDKL